MSQYYHLTSWEDIYRLYPNLQVDNVDSVQYMVQDDKIIQYTDAQGQQTLTAIDNANMQFGQTPATQQGVFVIEAVETQQLETNRSGTSSEKPEAPTEHLTATVQPSQKMVESQQTLVLKHLDQPSSELLLQKEVPNGENKPQCIQPMDQNNLQLMNQQSQFVIHPIQANVVQLDSSKQQSNSLQTQYISLQKKEVNNTLKGSIMERTNKKDLQQLPMRQLEGNKGAVVGQINPLNNQQQFVMQPIETSYQKAVVDLGMQDRQLIMQQVDGTKQNSFIVQQLGSNNQCPNQILVNQLKTQKNQHAVIQNIQFTQKDSQTLKLQNIENPQFIMQKLDGCKQQQAHYQMQHFIVPQGERHQPKVVVQRLEINKQMTSAPQLIVQQFQPVTSNQGTQFVVQQLDLNKQQNILPYIFSSPTHQPTSNETVQEAESSKSDGNGSQGENHSYKCADKEEAQLVQFSSNQGVLKATNDDGSDKQERLQATVSIGQELKSLNQIQEQIVDRLNQPSQPGEAVEQSRNESERRFVNQEIVQQSHIQRPVQEVQETERCSISRTAENCRNASACSEQNKGADIMQVKVQSQQTSQFIQKDNAEADNLSTNKPETPLQLDKTGAGVLSMQSSISAANFPNSRRITLKHNESESYPAGVLIIPRGDNQMYIGQYQTGYRLQGTQTMCHTVVKQLGGEKTKSNDKGSQTGDLSSQNVVVQQERPMLQPAAPSDPQKSSNLTGLSQNKTSIKSHIKPGSSDPVNIKAGEIMITSRLPQSPVNRLPATLTSEQISESLVKEGDRREVIVQSCGHGNPSQSITTHAPNPAQTTLRTGKGAGRGSRANLATSNQKAVLPTSTMVRGVQVQTTLTRLPQAELVIGGRKSKGIGNVAVGEWSSNSPDVRNQVGPRPIIYQLASVNSSTYGSNNNAMSANNINIVNSTTNVNISNSDIKQYVENVDETRMLVLLPNGERKLVRFPINQQSVHIQQLWQQVRCSLGSQISIVSKEQTADKTSTSQLLIKGLALENQESHTTHDSSNPNQISTTGIQNSGNVQSSTAIVAQQQKPRGVSPRLGNNSPGNGGLRPRTQCSIPRMPAPRVINQRVVTPQHQQSQTVVTHNTTLPGAMTQVQPIKDTATPQQPKEAPRFIPGQVAICPFCGISSLDFNKCIRCRRKLPPNVKSQSIFTAKKKSPEKVKLSKEELLDSTKPEADDKNTENTNTENKGKNCSPVTDRKKPKPSPKKKKITEEPAEILILSSDEEEENNQSKLDSSVELPVLFKEPVCEAVQLTEEEMAAIKKETHLADDLMGNVQSTPYTTFLCRAVRIGSFKTQLKERLLLSSYGIRLVVSSLNSETVKIYIPSSEIMKILIHLGKQMPIIFVYATQKMGYHIRSLLGMENKTGPYYDPTAQQEETHKRITFLLEKVTEDNRVVMQNIFPQDGLLEELSEKEANEILVRASPIDEQGTVAVRPTDAVKKIMIYPPPPEKGGIPLNNQDYACLGEDQFLNDVIIDFYLKYLWLKVLSPEDRERTHIFSTFFYKRLTTKPKTVRKCDPENDPKLTPAEKRHIRVKGWTKQVNLFEKDFIIVPINEHAHWFLAIICFPGLNGPVKFSDNSPVEPEEVSPKKSTHTVQIGNTTITHIVKTERNSSNAEMDTGSDRDEAEGDQDDLHLSSEDEESEQVEEETQSSSTQVEIPLLSPQLLAAVQPKELKTKPVRKKPVKEPIKQPCILIFDSLAGASRVRVVATLRDYLKIEYKKKMGHDREFNKDTIKGAVPKVPQQNNFTDCGLYVLQYVESFFRDPLHDFKLPLRYLQDWFPEEVVACKRRELASLIRSLMEEQGIKVDEIGLPNLTFANENNVAEKGGKLEEGEEEKENVGGEEGENRTTVAPSGVDSNENHMDIDEEDEEDAYREEDEEDESSDDVGMASCYPYIVHPGTNKHLEIQSLLLDTKSPELPLKKFIDPNIGIKFKRMINEMLAKGENGEHEEENTLDEEEETTELKKSVPLTEYQDFELQLAAATIENTKRILRKAQFVISESEEEDDEGEDDDGEVEEEETEEEGSSAVVADVENIALTETIGNLDVDEDDGMDEEEQRAAIPFSKKLVHRDTVVDVTNVNSKNRSENSVTDPQNDWRFSDQHVKENSVNQDPRECVEMDSQKIDSPSVKRSFEALKSVRIPKKTERDIISNKRQRMDES